MAIKISGDTVIFDDQVFKVGAGTTGTRPITALQGMLRYNTTLQTFEGYDGTTWSAVGKADELTKTLAISQMGSV
jgi:hypothetical protein